MLRLLMDEQTPPSAWFAWLEMRACPASSIEDVRRVYKQLPPLSEKTYMTTVAGTNGKGGCVHALDALLRAHGRTTIRLTSPHLHDPIERITLNGQSLPDETWQVGFRALQDLKGQETLSYFAYVTLLAFWAASYHDVDELILEVGLGGRLDAVNVHPANMAIITHIGLDHQDRLGHDLETIGAEKAGIIHPGCTSVLGFFKEPKSVLERAHRLSEHVFSMGQDFHISTQTTAHALYQWQWEHADMVCAGSAAMGLSECALACAIQALSIRVPAPDPILIANVISALRLPGRFECIKIQKLPWVFDVAHNPSSVRRLLACVVNVYPNQAICAFFAIMAHKDWREVLAVSVGVVDHWYLPLSVPDGFVDPIDIAKHLEVLGVANHAITPHGYVPQDDTMEQSLVLVFGSFSWVSMVQRDIGLVDQGRKLYG